MRTRKQEEAQRRQLPLHRSRNPRGPRQEEVREVRTGTGRGADGRGVPRR